MITLRIALAQMRCEKGDWPGNLDKVDGYLAEARTQGCDVVVLPEMGLSGYCDPGKFPEAVQSLDSPLVRQFVEMTGKHQIAASGGFIEENPGEKPFITQVLAQHGQIIGVYRKVRVVDEEADWFSPGHDTPVFNLPLDGRTLCCALAVCADSDRPSLFADFAWKGAQVVFHSSAPGLYGRRTDVSSWQAGYDWYKGHLWKRLPVYGKDYGLFIAVATQTGSTVDEDFPGGSYVFGPDGSCLAEVGGYQEALLVCDLTIIERPR